MARPNRPNRRRLSLTQLRRQVAALPSIPNKLTPMLARLGEEWRAMIGAYREWPAQQRLSVEFRRPTFFVVKLSKPSQNMDVRQRI